MDAVIVDRDCDGGSAGKGSVGADASFSIDTVTALAATGHGVESTP